MGRRRANWFKYLLERKMEGYPIDTISSANGLNDDTQIVFDSYGDCRHQIIMSAHYYYDNYYNYIYHYSDYDHDIMIIIHNY